MSEEQNNEMTDEIQNVVNEPAAQPPEKVFCARCGSEILAGQEFCPKCGQKVGEKLVEMQDKKMTTGNTKKVAAGVAAIIVVVIVVIFLVRGTQAKEITLNKSSITVKVGETAELTYTISPEKTKNKNVDWKSSNDSIASVSDGKIAAKNEGDCTITVTTKNGKTDTCEIVVEPAGPDFTSIFNEYCSSTYATVASDGSYLLIDTNPDDSEFSDVEGAAIVAIIAVNEALELPDSVLNKMGKTRSLDGMQTYEADDFEVTWTYHPDNGLEVMYALTN
ncbi:MAG: Ig-like domain-containing protein [Lachnospiraceae bacterium]|nr:Ig-like domain-containing protein [Lachnospiraceae bacterium]